MHLNITFAQRNQNCPRRPRTGQHTVNVTIISLQHVHANMQVNTNISESVQTAHDGEAGPQQSVLTHGGLESIMLRFPSLRLCRRD